MGNLDSIDKIKQIDKSNLINSIYNLSDQLRQAWEEINSLKINSDYSEVQNIVVAGMGGSALGGRVVDAFLFDKIRVPIEIITDFRLPNYVNSKTLVILSSYSGGTAETISAYYEASKKNAKIFGLTTGGRLAEVFKNDRIDSYVFNPFNNPSGQPRMSLGYSIGGILAILAKHSFITFAKDEIDGVITFLQQKTKDYAIEISENENLAKKFAQKLYNKSVALISAEHLLGVSHAFKNQLNENAKTLSFLFDLPELNHHLLEGLSKPAQMRQYLSFVLVISKNFSEDLQKVTQVTKSLIKETGFEVEELEAQGQSKLEEIFYILVFGSYVSYYLAILYGIDPTPIPTVDEFKKRLK